MGTEQDNQASSKVGFYSAGALKDIILIYPLYCVMLLDNGITPL